MRNYFKTGNRLKVALDHANDIPGFQDILDQSFIYSYFDVDEGYEDILDGKLSFIPYWIDQYKDNEDYRCQYVDGYYEPNNYNDILDIDGSKYRYVDSIALSEEMEHQANDGKYQYEYRGYSYMRILEPITV